jgi:hypothetical protein
MVGYSQIGMTEYEIRQEYSNSTIESAYTTGGQYYLSTELKNCYIAFYFEDNKVISLMIIPNSNEKLNGYIEFFNNNYVIISNTKWRKYANGVYTDIVLKYSAKHKSSYFLYN